MYFFILEVKISLQMSKFPGNQVPEFLIFSRHGGHPVDSSGLESSHTGEQGLNQYPIMTIAS